MRPVVLAALAVLAAAPAAAHAGTVTMSTYMECYGDSSCSKYQAGTVLPWLDFKADAGERNDLRIEPAPENRVRITDRGAPLRATGCEAVSANEALCPAPGLATIDLGDLEDAADLPVPGTLQVGGGPGDDAIAGGPGGGTFDGGPGRDRIAARAGNDTLHGSLEGEPLDELDGGEGHDTVDYARRAAGVAVALDVAAGPHAVDLLTGIEGVRGGPGDDTLTGSEQADRLEGGEGRDEVRGNGGDDAIDPGLGADRVDGGAGNDRIALDDRVADRVACGDGRDVVIGSLVDDDYAAALNGPFGVEPNDVLRPDCERALLRHADVDDLVVDPRVRVTGSLVRVRNPCATASGKPCAGVLRVRGGPARAARGFRRGRQWVVLRLRGAPTLLRLRVAMRIGRVKYRGGWTADVAPSPVG